MFTNKELEEVNKKLDSIPVKGKNYVQVTERIKAFRSICPGGNISTEIVSLENGTVTMKTTVANEDGFVLATGWAQEKESSSYINKTSFIENCETSAVGRALGFVGIGIDASMASAEEVANAIKNQGNEKTDEQKNAEMKASVDPVYLVAPDGKVTEEQKKKFYDLLKKSGQEETTVLDYLGVKEFSQVTGSMIVPLITKMEKSLAKKSK